MTQFSTSVNGGVVDVQTTTGAQGTQQVSRQFVSANNLQTRPTEWIAGGRPIYRRLPAVNQTYQVDFDADGEIGYCFIPWGEGIFGPVSIEVVATDTKSGIFVKGGVIVWKYGRNPVIPTLVDFTVLDVSPGKYLVGYDLVYDNAPFEAIYEVDAFALTGEELNITSSTDSVVGWRYPTVNAFLNGTTTSWKNNDTFLPTYAQPTSAFLQWVSPLASAYTSITLRCPSNTVITGSASLYYTLNGIDSIASTVDISSDTTGQFFAFTDLSPSFQTGWKVEFTDSSASIQSIVVAGQVTQIRRPSGPVPKAALAMYPSFEPPADRVFCALAYVDVGNGHRVEAIQDIRNVTHRNLEPVANWLTTFWDENLISLYETAKTFATTWMAPTTALKGEYVNLEKEGVILSTSVTLGQ